MREETVMLRGREERVRVESDWGYWEWVREERVSKGGKREWGSEEWVNEGRESEWGTVLERKHLTMCHTLMIDYIIWLPNICSIRCMPCRHNTCQIWCHPQFNILNIYIYTHIYLNTFLSLYITSIIYVSFIMCLHYVIT